MSVEASPPEAASDHRNGGLADLLSRRDRELLKRQSCSQWELVGVGGTECGVGDIDEDSRPE